MKTGRIFSLLSATLFVALSAGLALTADDPPAAGTTEEAFQFGGIERRYTLHVPSAYEPTGPPVALVFVLHGVGGTGKDTIVRDGWVSKADRDDFIVVAPDALPLDRSRPPDPEKNPALWDDLSPRIPPSVLQVDDVGFIGALVDRLTKRFDIDPTRIDIAGFSDGGSMAMTAADKLSDRFAAVGAVSGEFTLQKAVLASPVSIIYVTGLNDPLNPFAGGAARMPWGTEQKPPVMNTVTAWQKMLRCPQPAPRLIGDFDGVKGVAFDPCEHETQLEFYTVEGLGHVWPGGSPDLPVKWTGSGTDKLNATHLISHFFFTHPKPPRPGQREAETAPAVLKSPAPQAHPAANEEITSNPTTPEAAPIPAASVAHPEPTAAAAQHPATRQQNISQAENVPALDTAASPPQNPAANPAPVAQSAPVPAATPAPMAKEDASFFKPFRKLFKSSPATVSAKSTPAAATAASSSQGASPPAPVTAEDMMRSMYTKDQPHTASAVFPALASPEPSPAPSQQTGGSTITK